MTREGTREASGEFVELLDSFQFWFNIVTAMIRRNSGEDAARAHT